MAKPNAEGGGAPSDPEVNKKLADRGLETIADSPQQFAAYLNAEAKRMLPFIRSLNIRLD